MTTKRTETLPVFLLSMTLLALLLAMTGCDALSGSDGDGSNKDAECGDDDQDGEEVCDGEDLDGKTCIDLGFSGGNLGCNRDCDGFDTSDCLEPIACGNSILEPGETCDGTDIGDMSCFELGFGPGPLACKSECDAYDLAGCGAPASCGNDQVEAPEACDGTELNGTTCLDLGRNGGTLACLPNCADYDESACGPRIVCGNGRVEPGEICDLTDLNSETCASIGFGPGPLKCQEDCLDFDRSFCEAPETCGNGKTDGVELCDGIDLNENTCQSLGYNPGSLSCKPNCGAFDTSACGPKIECGNNSLESGEVCDGTDLGGASCVGLGLGPGTLGCLPNCSDFDRRACQNAGDCGNNRINDGETCDGTDLDNKTCSDFGHWGGDLACAANCKSFDQSACIHTCTPQCGERECGPDPVCGENCGDCDRFSACDVEVGQCVQICDLDPIESNITLNIDLETATINGTITLNGSRMPNNTQEYYEDNSRGHLVFIRKDTQSTYYISIGSDGAATYSTTLFAGTYDLHFESNNSSYQNVLPNQTIILAQDLQFAADTTRNFDLKTATLDGTLTLNGARMPNNTQEYYEDNPRGHLVLIRQDSADTYYTSIGYTGAASYSVEVFTGSYSLNFEGNSSSYQNVLPNQTIVLEQDLAVNGDTTFHADLKTATLSGTATLNGTRMPDNTQEYYEDNNRGWVVVIRGDTADTYYANVGYAGAASYSINVFQGTYQLRFEANNTSYQNVLPGQVIVLTTDLAVHADKSYNFDLITATLNGTITLNGARMPNNTQEYYEDNTRGWVILMRNDSGDDLAIPVGYTGAGTYSNRVFVGDYRLKFEANSSSYQNVLPSMEIVLDDSVTLNVDTTRDFDLKTVTIDGAVTLNGARMPNNTQEYYEDNSRGWIQFVRMDTGDQLSATIGSEGVANFSQTIFSGNYVLKFEGNNNSYQNVLPPQVIMLDMAATFQQSTTRNIDLGTATISGTVTLNGARMPNNTEEYYEDNERGHMYITNRLSGDTTYAGIGAQGAGAYSLTVFNGIYNAFFEANNTSYQNVLPGQTILLRTGCLNTETCAADIEDVTGTWYLVTDNHWWGNWTLQLIQNEQDISGAYSNTWNQAGALLSGSREGNTIKFSVQPYCYTLAEGTLTGGCMMSGWFQAQQCGGQDFARWFGIRLQ